MHVELKSANSRLHNAKLAPKYHPERSKGSLIDEITRFFGFASG